MKSLDSYPIDDIETGDTWPEPIDPENTILTYGNLVEIVPSDNVSPSTLFEALATEEATILNGKPSTYTTKHIIGGETTNRDGSTRWDELEISKPDED